MIDSSTSPPKRHIRPIELPMAALAPQQDRTGPDVAGPLDARERLNFNPLIEIDRSRLGVEDTIGWTTAPGAT